jgi:hypothetical protein
MCESNNDRGNKTMKKLIAAIIMIALSVFAAPASDSWTNSTATLIDTPLPEIILSPLAALDLMPDPAPKPEYASMNLDPNQVTINPGHRYLQRSLRGSAFGDTMFNANLLAMVALNVGDFLSTSEALKYPGLAEGNPMMKPFVKNPYTFAAVKVGLTALTYVSLKGLYKKSKPMAWIAATAANLFLGYVVSNNYRMIGMAKGI